MDLILSEREISHTLNLCIGWEITLYGDQFYTLQQWTSVMRMNGLYELSPPDPTKYILHKHILWPGKWWMFVDGMVHETLMNDGYKCKEDWDVDIEEIGCINGKSFSYMRMMKWM